LIIGYVALHESDILDDLPNVFPSDRPAIMAPSPIVPDSVVLDSDTEPASLEAPVELMDVEMDEVRLEKPVATRGGSEGKEAVVEKSAADKKGEPAAMESDRMNFDDVVVVNTNAIEYTTPPLASEPPIKKASSSEIAGAGRSKEPVKPDVAAQAAQPDEAISVQRDIFDLGFELHSVPLLTEEDQLSKSSDTTLTEWREIRDQNLAAYPQTPPDMAVAFSAEGAKSKVSRQQSAADSDSVSGEELLLRAWYQIALATDDPDERAAAMSFLEQYIKDEKARFSALAGDYLKELEESSE
jgi:hypothetical protein